MPPLAALSSPAPAHPRLEIVVPRPSQAPENWITQLLPEERCGLWALMPANSLGGDNAFHQARMRMLGSSMSLHVYNQVRAAAATGAPIERVEFDLPDLGGDGAECQALPVIHVSAFFMIEPEEGNDGKDFLVATFVVATSDGAWISPLPALVEELSTHAVDQHMSGKEPDYDDREDTTCTL